MFGNHSENLLPQEIYKAYKDKEFIIKFVAIGLSSGSASFKVWPCK